MLRAPGPEPPDPGDPHVTIRRRDCLAAGAALAGAALLPARARSQEPARRPDVVFVPTPTEIVDEMLSLARVGPKDVLYDLGSGDGRIPITAAKRWGTRGIGVDSSPLCITAMASEISNSSSRSSGMRRNSGHACT